jgi:O-antigen ligase
VERLIDLSLFFLSFGSTTTNTSLPVLGSVMVNTLLIFLSDIGSYKLISPVFGSFFLIISFIFFPVSLSINISLSGFMSF